jgi:hypothetical protein
MSTQAPQRRSLRFDDWDQVLADVEMLAQQGYENAERGNWSLGQNCEHMAKPLEMAVDGFPKVASWPVRVVTRMLVLKKMLRHDRINFRARAPAFVVPADNVDDAGGIEHLRQAIERFRNHRGEFAPHVAFGQLDRDDWVHTMLWHCEHHLSFLVPHDAK